MSWFNAKSSATQLAERLKKFERKAADQPAPTPVRVTPAPPPAVYVKPTRVMPPSAEEVARAITAELADADLIKDVSAAPASEVKEAAETSESRRAPRKQQSLPAYITGPGMGNIIPARVIDMSATGAKVELTPMGRSTGIPLGDLPDRFALVLRQDRMEVDCEIVWRDEWLLGVRFLGFPRPMQDKR